MTTAKNEVFIELFSSYCYVVGEWTLGRGDINLVGGECTVGIFLGGGTDQIFG